MWHSKKKQTEWSLSKIIRLGCLWTCKKTRKLSLIAEATTSYGSFSKFVVEMQFETSYHDLMKEKWKHWLITGSEIERKKNSCVYNKLKQFKLVKPNLSVYCNEHYERLLLWLWQFG